MIDLALVRDGAEKDGWQRDAANRRQELAEMLAGGKAAGDRSPKLTKCQAKQSLTAGSAAGLARPAQGTASRFLRVQHVRLARDHTVVIVTPDAANIAKLDSSADLIPDRALRAREQDAFNHEAIASNLAAHVATAETRLNIALYGAWGSGKSSAFELLRRHLEGRSVKLVHYDASRYGGESLRRNFISHAATELGFEDRKKYRRFHGGLYEGRTHTAVELPESLSDWKKVGAPVFTLAVTLIGILLLVALVGVGVSFLTDKSPLNQVSAFLVGLAVPAGVAAVIVATAKGVLDGASITREQSRPSADEEFRRRFGELVTAAREKHHVNRLVFFFDELDRCSRADVVETLNSIRTFLDHDDCVFVVAADRDVLEQALTTHLQQPTPLNEDDPYYSSASSYLDKIFHHQLYLPPLRTMKLTHFAREMISGRGGLWAELREVGGQRALDRVIYALVPSHVVSPRRVKVLLNNFASNVRVVESRGIDWKSRGPEIAKLTALQVEFPSLASDLPHESRLPELLLDPPAEPSERLKHLLERHGVVYKADGDLDPQSRTTAGADAPATDPLLPSGDGVDREARREIISVQHRNLRRYLKRTSGVGIGNPGRDLLYLETVGELHGLEDIELSEVIEADATEEPDALIEKVAGRELDEKVAVVRILCDISEGEFGDERANVIKALLGVVEQLASRSQDVAVQVVESLRSFQADQELDERHLVGALHIALALDNADGRALREQVVRDARLLADATRTQRVALLLDQMDEPLAEVVAQKVAEHITDGFDTLAEPLRRLPTETAVALLEDPEVDAAVHTRYRALAEQDDDAAESFIESLYEAVGERNEGQVELLDALQWLLLENRIAYPVVRRHADETMEGMPPGTERDSHALMGLRMGGAADWTFWAPYLGDEPGDQPWRPAVVSHVGSEVLSQTQHVGARATASVLAPHAADVDDELRAEITSALTSALGAHNWWSGDDELAVQHDIYSTALELASVPGPLRREVYAVLREDVLRVTQRPAPPRPGLAQPASPLASIGAQRGLRELAPMLQASDRRVVLDQVRDVLPAGDAAVDAEMVRTALALAVSLSTEDESLDLGAPAVLLNALSNDATGVAAASHWLALDPAAETVVAIARRMDRNPPADLAQALDSWAERQDEGGRTEAVLKLLDVATRHTGWARRIAVHGIDDAAVANTVSSRIEGTSRGDDRERLVDFLVAVDPDGYPAHARVAQLMLMLLARDTKVDFDLALRAAPALGTDHRHGEKLRVAFERVADENGFRIPQKGLTALHAARVRPKQKSVAESALDTFKSFWGGGGKRRR